MSTLRTHRLEGLSTTNGIEFFDGKLKVDNMGFQRINRGAASSSTSLLLLEHFNQHHYYAYSGGANIVCRTSLVANAVYDMVILSNGGTANIDFVCQPNGNNYSNQFNTCHYFSGSGGDIVDRQELTQSNWYFDHFGGGDGSDGFIQVRFTTDGLYKRMLYRGSDSRSLCFGRADWNTSTSWSWVGNLNFNGDNKRLWIWRVA